MNILQIFFVVALMIQSQFVLDSFIITDANDFMVDDLNNVYLITGTGIERRNSAGKGSFVTSELNYGNIEYFDVTNPLKPFIHYRSSGKLVLFDNTLSRQGEPIDLFEKGFEQVEFVAGSRGDAYWFWDSRNSELIRVDQNFQKISSTGNLSVMLGLTINPKQIIERGSHVYIRDELNGLIVFDIYGTYRTRLNIQTSIDVQVYDDQIIYFDHSSVHVMGRDWLTEETLELPFSDPGRIFFVNGNLYCLQAGRLEVWKFHESRRN